MVTAKTTAKAKAKAAATVKAKETDKSRVYKIMKSILAECPDGCRAGELASRVNKKMKGTPIDSTRRDIWENANKYPKELYKEDVKGGVVYYAKKIRTNKKSNKTTTKQTKHKEVTFYPSFAEYLQRKSDEKERLAECSKAISLGGSVNSQGKWTTPDVIGVLKADHNDIVKFPDEIVSAEIKIDSKAIMTAFGQACAYRLFSHKVYLVIPKPSDHNRIEKLCQIFGIGLVYFDPDQKPHVSIYNLKLPAQKQLPDMYYVNKTMKIKNIANKLYT